MEKELPKGWEKVEFNTIIDYAIGGDWGKDPEKINDSNFEEVLCIRGAELKNWTTEKGQTATKRKVKNSSLEKRKLIEGDILVEISGGGPEQPVGRTVFIDNKVLDFEVDTPKVCTNFFRLVRTNAEINSKLINYYLQYFYQTGEIVNYQGGSNNLRNLRFPEYISIKIPLPPLPEQQRIVTKLDTLFASLDNTRARLEKIPRLLKNFRQAVLTQAVTGNWDFTILYELTDKIGSGATPQGGQSAYKSEGIPLVRSMNVHFNGMKYEGLAFIDDKQAEKLKNAEIEGGDVLLNITGASIGRVCVAEKGIIGGRVNQHVAIIRPKDRITSKYLNIYLSSSFIQNFIHTENYGVTRQALTKTQIQNFKIPLPTLQEQHEIVRRVESLFAKADTIEQQYQKLKEKVDALPQAILAKAFRGELVEQNPLDEPASVLLERIRAEKEKMVPKGKKTTMKQKADMAAEPDAKYGKRRDK